MTPPLATLLTRLRRGCAAQHTQADLGALLGVHASTIARVEAGAVPSADVLAGWLAATDATDAQRLEALRLAETP